MNRLLFCIITAVIVSVMSSCVVVGYTEISDNTTAKEYNKAPETENVSENITCLTEKIEHQTETTGETAEEKLKIRAVNPKFEEYLKINNDVVGYIEIEGTNIDYPVLYNGDNDYYLSHNIYKQPDKYGAVFMDMTSRGAMILEKNTIIHGHNFYDGELFHHLESFKKKDFFDYYKIIKFDNLYSDMEWEVFSVYVINEDEYFLQTEFLTHEDYLAYIEMTKSVSIYWRDYIPVENDHILTLHTCSGEFKNAHTIVHAKLINIIEYWQEDDDFFKLTQ